MSKRFTRTLNKLESEKKYFEKEKNKKTEKDEFIKRQETINVEIEAVNVVAEKLKEKYSEYEALNSFIDYLASTEKIFVIAKYENKNAGKAKEAFLRAELHLMSMKLGVEQVIFEKIIDRFEEINNNVTEIISLADELRKEYKDDDEVIKFVDYTERALLEFLEVSDGGLDVDREKIKRIDKYMEELSADGDPRFEELKKIYDEFKNRLKLENDE